MRKSLTAGCHCQTTCGVLGATTMKDQFAAMRTVGPMQGWV
jgi:hypothetical protein